MTRAVFVPVRPVTSKPASSSPIPPTGAKLALLSTFNISNRNAKFVRPRRLIRFDAQVVLLEHRTGDDERQVRQGFEGLAGAGPHRCEI